MSDLLDLAFRALPAAPHPSDEGAVERVLERAWLAIDGVGGPSPSAGAEPSQRQGALIDEAFGLSAVVAAEQVRWVP